MLRKMIPLLILLCLFSIAASAQDCNPPAITANSKIYNIFSPEQEMTLGELYYQQMSGDSRFIQDEKLLAYVRAIGAKLVGHLPPTGLKFQFFIIDMPTANAFNAPGGYVFRSDEKLLAYVRAIGAKLVGHLPPTGLKFQFFIIDMPTANAFNAPGGYVF